MSFEQQKEDLRDKIHKELREALQKRLDSPDLNVTEDELRLGAFMEELEPQVRDALVVLNKKGYQTHSSGFYGESGELQAIDIEGKDLIDQETIQKLNDMNVRVGINEWSPDGSLKLEFKPENQDIQEIKEKWDKIAEVLPDRGSPTFSSSMWGGAMEELDEKMRFDIMKRRYELGFYNPDQKEEYEKWLKDNNPDK